MTNEVIICWSKIDKFLINFLTYIYTLLNNTKNISIIIIISVFIPVLEYT